jgi:uncharacterized membrane protein YfcA
LLEFVSLIALGAFAGTLAGLLGIGGGAVIVPILILILQSHPEIPSEHIMHIAIGTSLATIVLTAISSIIAHQRHAAINWQVTKRLAPWIVIGSLSGAMLAGILSNLTLKVIFLIFLFIIALQMIFGKPPAPHRQLPKILGLGFVGISIGIVSSLVGIAGGSMTVPFLVMCNIPMRNAVATSVACGFPIAVAGAIGFILTGWNTTGLPTSSTLGYVYIPAFLTITPLTLLFAPFGAKLAHSIPVNTLKKVFALFLIALSMKMLLELVMR